MTDVVGVDSVAGIGDIADQRCVVAMNKISQIRSNVWASARYGMALKTAGNFAAKYLATASPVAAL